MPGRVRPFPVCLAPLVSREKPADAGWCALLACTALIQGGLDSKNLEVIPEEQQLPAQRSAASVMAGRAARAWWAPRHPGWMILTLGGRHFDSLDEVMLVRHPASPRLQPVTVTTSLDLDTGAARLPARSKCGFTAFGLL